MRTLTARPALRWLLPLALLLVLLGSVLVGTRASADPALPPRSAEQLLVDLQTAKVDGLSGTVVQNADLGIPALPGASDSPAGKFSSLISGSHTLRVWYSGPDKARLALQDEYAETDVITNGSDVWTYDSSAKTATHRILPADQKQGRPKAPKGAPKTPQEAAQLALQAIGKSTDVTTDRAVQVAGRSAYELVLTPRDKASLVTGIRIAVDGQTHLPLRVQVFGSADKPVIEIGYTSVTIGRPDARMFAFNPPAGTKVTEAKAPAKKAPATADRKAAEKKLEARKAQADARTKVVGDGWTQVVVTKLGKDAVSPDNATAKSFLGQLKPVSGSWGSGRQLDGTIFTAILTDDGRLAVGAVGPDQVQRALAR